MINYSAASPKQKEFVKKVITLVLEVFNCIDNVEVKEQLDRLIIRIKNLNLPLV